MRMGNCEDLSLTLTKNLFYILLVYYSITYNESKLLQRRSKTTTSPKLLFYYFIRKSLILANPLYVHYWIKGYEIYNPMIVLH